MESKSIDFNLLTRSDIRCYVGKSWKPLPKKMATPALDEMTESIVSDILKIAPLELLEKIRISNLVGPNNDQMEYVILDKLSYRHCAIYLVLQYSHNTKKLRVIAYGINHFAHSSWGTSLESVEDNTLRKYVQEAFEKNFSDGQIKISTTFAMLEKIKNNDYLMFL